MKKYLFSPFKVGSVYFASKEAQPLFQINITTQEGVVFFESSVYPCFMVHRTVKKKLEESSLTGFHFPAENYTMEYSSENSDFFEKKNHFPKWHWIVFSSNPDDDVYMDHECDIICDDRFIDIVKSRRLNEERATLTEIKNTEIEKEDLPDIPIFKKEKAFNLPLFIIMIIFAVILSVIFFA